MQESALLAGIVQSPSRYDPVNDEAEATKRRNTVLQRMADVRDISQAEADRAKKTPIEPQGQPARRTAASPRSSGAGFFCDYVREVFLTDPVFGKTRRSGPRSGTRAA